MANEEHLNLLKHGVDIWNQWRTEHSEIRPDLSEADLSNIDLSSANLNSANFSGADLRAFCGKLGFPKTS